MHCKYCGKEIGDEATFCQHCGKPISSPLPPPTSKTKKSKAPLIIILAVICVTAVVAVGLLAKHSADRKRAEAEALAASIAESEAIAESIAQAEAIAESIAEAEAIAESIAKAEESVRSQYITDLEEFVLASAEGFDIGQNMCQIIYMTWYDINAEEYREETAAYTMVDGKYRESMEDAIQALFDSEQYQQQLIALEENKEAVSKIYKQINNPPEGFEECFDLADSMLDAYLKLYRRATAISAGETLYVFNDEYNEITTTYVNSIDRILVLIPTN